jgi:hypothetical protein
MIHIKEENLTFKFDRIYSENSTQDEIYDCVKETIDDVLNGYNGTIFAYGQTGTNILFLTFRERKDSYNVWSRHLRSRNERNYSKSCQSNL